MFSLLCVNDFPGPRRWAGIVDRAMIAALAGAQPIISFSHLWCGPTRLWTSFCFHLQDCPDMQPALRPSDGVRLRAREQACAGRRRRHRRHLPPLRGQPSVASRSSCPSSALPPSWLRRLGSAVRGSGGCRTRRNDQDCLALHARVPVLMGMRYVKRIVVVKQQGPCCGLRRARRGHGCRGARLRAVEWEGAQLRASLRASFPDARTHQ